MLPLLRRNTVIGCLVLGSALGSFARADITLASPFTDHMVLQRDMPVPVWGWADPGERIAVQFAGQKETATAAADGTWKLNLRPLATSAEPREFKAIGKEEVVTLHDVLVGEVWLASGQSNMDFTLAKTDKYYFAGVNNAEAEIAAADHPNLRMFTGEWTKSYDPQKQVEGVWRVCTPEAAPEFSAVAYFFARDLQRTLNVPVGIITMTYGASTAQAWIRREAIDADPRLKQALDEFDAKVKAYVPPTQDEMKLWQKAAEKAKTEKKRAPRKPHTDPVQDQHNPTVMFNGMIAPVVPFAIRGVIWYQGESITPPKELFPVWNETLITDWRKLWCRPSGMKGVDALPFYFCQLAAHDNPSNGPDVRAWQAEALKLPDTGMAVTIDIGDARNVHPKNKKDVGDRLCRIALAKTYGERIEYSGPVLSQVTSMGGAVKLSFSHAEGGLNDHGSPLKTFEVAGADGVFHPATANIDGTTLFVSSPDVGLPVKVRYAWSAYPAGCNLYNEAGLPAAPFLAEVK